MQELESLFDEWKKEIGNSKIFKERPFIKDGVIDEKVYYNPKNYKVLFISNESNIDGYFNPNENYDIRKDFIEYADKGHDKWQGKLRERVTCLYQVIVEDYSKPSYKYAKSFAFINLNKTGGGKQIDNRIQHFCEHYGEYIREEIKIIKPELIVWLGCNTFDNGEIRENRIGIKKTGELYYLDKVPVIRMCHTSYSRIRGERFEKFDNAIVDRMAYRLNQELKKIPDRKMGM